MLILLDSANSTLSKWRQPLRMITNCVSCVTNCEETRDYKYYNSKENIPDSFNSISIIILFPEGIDAKDNPEDSEQEENQPVDGHVFLIVAIKIFDFF